MSICPAALLLRMRDREQRFVLCGRHDLRMIFNAHRPALLGFDRMRRGPFLQVEGTFGMRRAMLKGEDDLSGGYWFESSRRSKTPAQRGNAAKLSRSAPTFTPTIRWNPWERAEHFRHLSASTSRRSRAEHRSVTQLRARAEDPGHGQLTAVHDPM